MLRAALVMARKDLRLTLDGGGSVLQPLLLGLLLIFIFSLSLAPGQRMSAQGSAAVFWMASAFCQVLIFSALYALEEDNGQRQGLVLAPSPLQGVWLGKALAGFCLLIAAQLLFLPAIVVFLGQEVSAFWPSGLAIVAVADVGAVSAGSLLGALSQGRGARESLLSLVLFPLLAPLFLGGIRIGAAVFSGTSAEGANDWFGIALAFDALFAAAALLLFPAVYTAVE